MDFSKFEAGKDDNDRRIDKVIRIFCPDLNLSSIYKYIRKGLIKVNNKKISQEYRVQTGDIILIADFILNKETNESSVKTEIPKPKISIPELKVIFRNNDLLAINKPYDYVVHGNSNDNKQSLETIVKNTFKAKTNSLAFTPGPLHRLDKKTTGILFFSQSLEGARWFSENLRNHKIQKKYIGIVQGKLLSKEIWIDEISRDEEDNSNKAFHKVSVHKTDKSKTAETEATPLFCGKYTGNNYSTDITVVQYYIKTGRTHQIRSQSSIHGYPLIGDTAYGGKELKNEKRQFFLHAQKIIFLNSMAGADFPSEITCNLDDDFCKFVSKTCGITKLEL